MKTRTRTVVAAPPEAVWPLLTNSRMQISGWFLPGMPRPQLCMLPDGEGGVGAARKCESDRGETLQIIDVWDPPRRLEFHMQESSHRWRDCVDSLVDEFVLGATGDRSTEITRTTHLTWRGWRGAVAAPGLWLGVKRAHTFVFANWRAEAGS